MKFNLTITEMNEEEFANLFANINCKPVIQPTVVVTKEPEMSKNHIVEGDFEEPAPFEPAYDKNGLPWDARIHSSNHKLTDKGVWQRRRGITDMEFERVRNELLGLAPEPVAPVVAEPTAPVVPVVAPTPLPVEPTPVAPVQPMFTNPTVMSQPVFAPTPAPVAPIAQPTPDANALYQTMFEKIKAGMAAGAVKANDVQNLINAVNAQFGTQYQTLAAVKDNANVLQYIINDLASKGL